MLCVQVEQVSSNFRTMETLQRTQSHLLALMNRRDVPLARIHHFLWDRCRGVRQDLFVQGYEVRHHTIAARACLATVPSQLAKHIQRPLWQSKASKQSFKHASRTWRRGMRTVCDGRVIGGRMSRPLACMRSM